MNNRFLSAIFLISTLSMLKSHAQAQQQYSGNSVMDCNSSTETGPSVDFLYTCDTENPSCVSFMIFRTEPPYISVSSIANLTSSDPTQLARLNNISISGVFPPGQEVIVPVTCSCLGQYYQANSSYVSRVDTYFTIANKTYQGLTTCNALMLENPYGELDLQPGYNLRVPLRCACPSQEQVGNGVKFMMTYLVTWEDTVPKISHRFNITARSVASANGFTEEDPVLYPFTTLLLPLHSEPLSTQTRRYNQTNTSYSEINKQRRSNKGLLVGLSAGAALAILCFVLFLTFRYCKRWRRDKESQKMREGGLAGRLPNNFKEKVVKYGEIWKIYTYQELEAATDKFSPQKQLSNFVYKGILRGKLSVIKRMGTDVSKEIKILGNINHFNLISLYGVCEHEDIYYLVYEYLEQGSLRNWLREDNDDPAHSWNQRILIALDIANGLDYLHNFASPAYVHKDINSRNILLNANMRAKIANFSLARENVNSETTRIVGEKGYMAPEYVETGKVTPKADVYALGVVLLELITGKNPVVVKDGKEFLLSEAVISKMNGVNLEDAVNELIDTRLQIKHPLGYIICQSDIATRLLKISFACLARQPGNRLSIAEVVSALMKIQSDVYNSQSFTIGHDY